MAFVADKPTEVSEVALPASSSYSDVLGAELDRMSFQLPSHHRRLSPAELHGLEPHAGETPRQRVVQLLLQSCRQDIAVLDHQLQFFRSRVKGMAQDDGQFEYRAERLRETYKREEGKLQAMCG